MAKSQPVDVIASDDQTDPHHCPWLGCKLMMDAAKLKPTTAPLQQQQSSSTTAILSCRPHNMSDALSALEKLYSSSQQQQQPVASSSTPPPLPPSSVEYQQNDSRAVEWLTAQQEVLSKHISSATTRTTITSMEDAVSCLQRAVMSREDKAKCAMALLDDEDMRIAIQDALRRRT